MDIPSAICCSPFGPCHTKLHRRLRHVEDGLGDHHLRPRWWCRSTPPPYVRETAPPRRSGRHPAPDIQRASLEARDGRRIAEAAVDSVSILNMGVGCDRGAATSKRARLLGGSSIQPAVRSRLLSQTIEPKRPKENDLILHESSTPPTIMISAGAGGVAHKSGAHIFRG